MECVKELELNAYAKINLSLDVTGRRPNGYHDVRMIMQAIDLYDRVQIRIAAPESEAEDLQSGGAGGPELPQIRLTCSRRDLPVDSRNLACRAAERYLEILENTGGISSLIDTPGSEIHIHLEKRIPAAAGLAGGSSDAAAVLFGLNRLAGDVIPDIELMDAAVKIGADVPFCLAYHLNGVTCALAEGIGEILTALDGIDAWVLLVKPDLDVSTAEIYNEGDRQGFGQSPDTELLLRAMKEGNLKKITQNMKNVLEKVTISKYSIQRTVFETVKNIVPDKVRMSGSGPTVFSIFESEEQGRAAFEKISNIYADTFLVRTCKKR